MPVASILLIAFVATSAMTAFSYLYSYIRSKRFREPELLNTLLMRWIDGSNLSKNWILGWLFHYMVGVFFVFIFVWIWEKSDFDAGLVSGLLFGFLAGVIGVIGWQITFWLHSNPPEIKFKEYYLHLIFAHIVFGISSALTFNWL